MNKAYNLNKHQRRFLKGAINNKLINTFNRYDFVNSGKFQNIIGKENVEMFDAWFLRVFDTMAEECSVLKLVLEFLYGIESDLLSDELTVKVILADVDVCIGDEAVEINAAEYFEQLGEVDELL